MGKHREPERPAGVDIERPELPSAAQLVEVDGSQPASVGPFPANAASTNRDWTIGHNRLEAGEMALYLLVARDGIEVGIAGLL